MTIRSLQIPPRPASKRVSIALLVFLFVFGGLLGQLGVSRPAQANTTSVSFSGSNYAINAYETVSYTYYYGSAMASGGNFRVTFPAGFDVSAISGFGCNGAFIGATWTTTISGQVVYFKRVIGGGGTYANAGTYICSVNNVKNPASSGPTGNFELAITVVNGTPIGAGDIVPATGFTLTGGAITSANVEPATLIVGESGTATITFTTANPIPNDGKIYVHFPTGVIGFNIAGASGANCSSMDGSFAVTTSAGDMYITRSGGTSEPAGPQTCTVNNIVNGAGSGQPGAYQIYTLTSTDGTIDQINSVATDTLVPGALTNTNVEPATLIASAVGTSTVSFRTVHAVPANGKIKVVFPAGYVLTGVLAGGGGTCAPAYGGTMDGTFTTAVAGQIVTITRAGGSALSAGLHTCKIGSVANPSTLGTTGLYTIATSLSSASYVIDTDAAVPGDTITVPLLTSTDVEPATLVAGETGTATVNFTNVTSIPNNGKIKVTFPSGYNLTGVVGAGGGTCSSAGGIGGTMDGSFSTDVSGSTVTITRSGGTAKGVAAQICKIYGVVNPQVPGSTGVYGILTTTSADVSLDQNASVSADIIADSTGFLTVTDIEPATLFAGDTGTATVYFTVAHAIPANGKIKITFPSGFTVLGDSGTCSTMDGNWSSVAGSNILTITRSGGNPSAVGAHICTVTGLTNPHVTGSTGTYAIETLTNANVSIDNDAAVTADTITYGVLTNTNIEPASLIAGAVGSATVTYTTKNPVPANGKIYIGFPSGYDVDTATGSCSSGVGGSMDGSFATTHAGNVLILTRSGGNPSSVGDQTCIISNVTNPPTAGSTGVYSIRTLTAALLEIDRNLAVSSDTIVNSSGVMHAVSVDLAASEAGASGTVTIDFTTANPIPNDGRIKVTFPSGYDVSGASGGTCSTMNGDFATSVNGQSVFLTRSNGTSEPFGPQTCTIDNIKNPPVMARANTNHGRMNTIFLASYNTYAPTKLAIGAPGVFTVTTLTSGNIAIDTATIGGGNRTTDITTSVPNVAPTVGSNVIVSYDPGPTGTPTDDTITLVEGTTKNIHVYGTVFDANTSADISSVLVKFYSEAVGISCVVDNSDNCYSVTINVGDLDCVAQADGNTCAFDATFPLTFHTENTTFLASATVTDNSAVTSEPVSSSVQLVSSLLSVDVVTGIDYGSISVGATAEALLGVTNWGNKVSDLYVRSAPLACPNGGEIPANKVAFGGTSLDTSDTTFADYNLPKQVGSSAGSAFRNTTMSLGPINAVQGACHGILTLTALLSL